MSEKDLPDLRTRHGQKIFESQVRERYMTDPVFHARCTLVRNAVFQADEGESGRSSEHDRQAIHGAIIMALYVDDVMADRWKPRG